jgi:hypothetical protein
MEVCVESRYLLISPVAEWCENGSWKYEQNRVNMKTNTGGDPFVQLRKCKEGTDFSRVPTH